MFEQFSARAIDALNHAREEARRLEFAQVDSDHLLLGLIAEENGAAARALLGLGIDLRRARLAAEQLGGRGYMRTSQLSFGNECQVAFSDALALATERTPTLVDVPDLLAAVLSRPTSRASRLLEHLGYSLDKVSRALEALHEQDLSLPTPAPDSDRPVLPKHFHPRLLTAPARAAYELAQEMARANGHTRVGTEQLLAALLATPGAASRVLGNAGLTRPELSAIAHRVIGRGSGSIPERFGFTARAKLALDAAWGLARARGQERVGTPHMLLGLFTQNAGGALTLLDLLQANLAAIEFDIESALDEYPQDPEPPVAPIEASRFLGE